MDAATRDALLTQFAAYLATVDETDTAQTNEAEAPDLFTLLAELAALKSEVKLEARLVKSALDEFRALVENVREYQLRLDEERRQRNEQAIGFERQKQKDFLLELLEVRDRLHAGYEQASRFRPQRWWGCRAVGEFVAALATGMAMNLRRLDELLTRHEVQPVLALGQRFDPYTMRAIEVTRDVNQPAAVVVNELRPGFLYRGQLLRPAEVVVNRPEETQRLMNNK